MGSEQYYTILELESGASQEEIKAAYRRLAKIWHPDRAINPTERHQADAKFKLIQAAYEYLKDYDPTTSPTIVSSQPATNVSKSRRTNPTELVDQAKRQIAVGRYRDALDDLNLAIKLSPEYIEAFEQREIVSKHLGMEKQEIHDRVRASRLRDKQKREMAKAKAAAFKKRPTTPTTSSTPTTPSTRNTDSPKIHLPSQPIAQTWPQLTTIGTNATRFTVTRNGKTLVTADAAHQLRLWNLTTQQCFATLTGHDASISAISISHDDQLLVTADQAGKIQLWHLPSASRLRTLEQPSGVTAMVITPQREIITAHQDGSLHHWQTNRTGQPTNLLGHALGISQLALASDGQTIASTGFDNQLKVWPVPLRPTPLQTDDLPLITPHLIASPYGGWFSANVMGEIMQWSRTGKYVYTIQTYANQIHSIALNSDGKRLAIGLDKQIRIFDLLQQTITADLSPNSPTQQLTFTHDGTKLISRHTTGEINIWQAA
jgi:tetratricopeptide (TPR) repeat protein